MYFGSSVFIINDNFIYVGDIVAITYMPIYDRPDLLDVSNCLDIL